MALVRATTNCYTAVNAALDALERNDANAAVTYLPSAQSLAKILQTEARIHHKLLLNLEQENEARVENLTKEINNLFQKEQKLKQEENNLGVKISGLKANRQQRQQCRNDTRRRYEEAGAKQREAEEKREEYERTGWDSFCKCIFMGVRELIEDNKNRARQAERHKNHHGRELENADREISSIDAKINQVSF